MSGATHNKLAHRSRFYLTLALLLAPTFLGMALFDYYPKFSTIKHSFYDWDGQQTENFVGLKNFRDIFTRDTLFLSTFRLIGILLLANLVKMWPSIFTAIVLHRIRSPRWQYIYRVLFVLPMVIPGLVWLLVWKSFFDPTVGILNHFLSSTGLIHVLQWGDTLLPSPTGAFVTGQPVWLGHTRLIIPSLIFWGFPWIGTIGVLIYLAGLQNISSDIYEAAELDGVGSLGKVFRIELPLIMTQVRINLIFMTIATLNDYGMFLLLLGPDGGPGNKGMTPGLYMYRTAFIDGNFGYACALGMVLFVVLLGITVIYQKYVRVEK